MTNPSKAKLQERIDELESENQDLRDKLDAIADVVNGEEDEDEEEDEDD